MLLGSLLVLLVLVCIALATVILLQRSEGGALGMGGGPSGFMTARGAGDLLTRITSILAAVFFLLCLLLTVLSARTHAGGSIVDRLRVDAMTPDALNKAMRPGAAAPAGGAAPAPAPAGSAANIGAVTPAPGAPAPAQAPAANFEAPRPEVHTAPAVTPSAPPTATPDNGANHRPAQVGGLQLAPQSAPTVAPLAKPFPNSAPPASDAARPAASAGNTQGGQ